MILNIRKTLLTTVTLAVTVLASGANSAHAEAPVKLLVESQYGADVNATTGENYCTVASKNTCQAGMISAIPGGFGEYSPSGVAVDNDSGSPSYGNVYVGDNLNQRVQELTPAGGFVLMFGREVNHTKTAELKEPGNPHGITEAEENICTAASGNACGAGVISTEPGGFSDTGSLAVDPNGGNVYVAEAEDSRVDEYTEGGQFVLMIGKEVNKTKTAELKEPGNPHGVTEAEENICTAASGNVCGAGARAATGSTEHSAFALVGASGGLAAGGPKNLLYVGDEHRVQEFDASGTWVAELSLTAVSPEPEVKAQELALDQANGDLYLQYEGYHAQQLSNVIFAFDATGKRVAGIQLKSRETSALSLEFEALALDSSGRLAVIEREEFNPGIADKYFGSLLDAETGKLITEFSVLPGGVAGSHVLGLAFSAGNVKAGEELYAASENRHELIGYVPEEVAELVTGATACKEEAAQETSVAFECHLAGEVNPENVAQTETSFLWSADEEALNGPATHELARQRIPNGNALVPAPPGVIAGLRPNETIHYELSGFDELAQPPEPPLTGEVVSTVTPLVAPKILSAPSASFVRPFSADLSGELNPENANTEYYFEYGPGETLKVCPLGVRHENCPAVASTATARSAAYGKLATILEASGMQPTTVYHYRLVADSENTAKTEKRSSLETLSPEDEGSFTTAPAPVPQAVTGPASAIGTTFATVSGSVNPDGQPASYRFELGVYSGGLTQYGIVFSGSAGTGNIPVGRELPLTGLQPGTTYAYRIFIQSGYGKEWGETATFTTAGLPSVLVSPNPLAMLPIPSIAFPVAANATTTTKKTTTPKCEKGKKLAHGRCAKAKAKKRKRAKKSGASRKAMR